MDPFFTIVVFLDSRRFLLPLTLDSLKGQTEKRFEVILVNGKKEDRLFDFARQYGDLDIKILYPTHLLLSVSEMMNEALELSKGKYIQFLSSGDEILSQLGLSYLKELIEESKYPELVYFSTLENREKASKATFVPFNLERGIFPPLQASCLLRQAALKMGGFDPGLNHRSLFDLLCKIFKTKGARAVFTRRVFAGSELKAKQRPKEGLQKILETSKVLLRHFGPAVALKWLFRKAG